MVVRKIWMIPVLSVTCTVGTMLISSIIGAVKKHFPAVVPFISDGGSFPPEGCIFTQLLNMAAFFLIVTCYMRHRQTVEYYGNRLCWEERGWRYSSLVLMWIGIFSSIGLTVMANFPKSEVGKVHSLASFLTYLSMLIYAWGQIIIGYAMVPHMAAICINHFRLCIITISTVCFIFHEVSIAFHPFIHSKVRGWYGIRWHKSNPLLLLNHLLSSCSEWIMVLLVQLFIFSFVAELRFAYAHAPRVIFRRVSYHNSSTVDHHDVQDLHDQPFSTDHPIMDE